MPIQSRASRARRRRAASWSSRDILRAAGLVALVWVALKLLWFANEVLLLAFLGTLFGLAVAAGVDRLERRRVPRGIGAAFIVLSFVSVIYGLGSLVAPTIGYQARELRTRLPEAIERVEGWINSRTGLLGTLVGSAPADTAATSTAADTIVTTDTLHARAPKSALSEGIRAQMRGLSRYLFPFITSTLTVVASLLLIIVMAVYIGADPDLYHRGILHLFPRRARPRARLVLRDMAAVLRKWLLTQLIAMLVIGGATALVLLFIGVPAPFALAIIAGLLEFIPTIGPVLSAVPAVAMGFLQSPQTALAVLVAYVVIQQLENHLLIPLLMKRGMDLPPALTIITQALMALLFGFLGLMVAVPLLAAVLVPIKILYVEDVIGDEVSLAPAPPAPGRTAGHDSS